MVSRSRTPLSYRRDRNPLWKGLRKANSVRVARCPVPDYLRECPCALEIESVLVQGGRADPEDGVLSRLLAQAEATFRVARAGSTLRAYAHDRRQPAPGAKQNHFVALPASPQTVILYGADLVNNQHDTSRVCEPFPNSPARPRAR
jgi:hypothetical protein